MLPRQIAVYILGSEPIQQQIMWKCLGQMVRMNDSPSTPLIAITTSCLEQVSVLKK